MPPTPSAEEAPREAGFEYRGRFYVWSLTDTGKDLMIIDRFTKMPVHEFFQLIEDSFDRGRGPVLMAMIGTSIRHGNPDWSVERIIREVEALSISEDITFIDLDEEDEDGPPAEGDQEPMVASKEEPVVSEEPARTPNGSLAQTSEPSFGSPV
jgi:hypothetical protein